MPEALIAPFLLLLLVAALSDVATMQIPNWVSIALAAAFIPAAALAGASWPMIGVHLAFGAGVFLVCAGLFACGVLGGGDAKLLSAAAVWTGWTALLPFLVGTALAGGLLALAALAARRALAPSPSLPGFANRLLDRSRGVPYAVAIAAGGVFAAPHLTFFFR